MLATVLLNEYKKPGIIKSGLHYTRLILFRMSRVSGDHLRGFAVGSKLQGCSGSEPLATCGRFNRLWIWNPYLLHQKQTSTTVSIHSIMSIVLKEWKAQVNLKKFYGVEILKW